MKRTVIFLAAAGGCILAGGAGLAVTEHLPLWHGLYCALGTGATVGCDVTATRPAAQIVSAAVMLTAIPLLAAAFAALTGARLATWWHQHHGQHFRSELDTVRRKLTDEANLRHADVMDVLDRQHQDLLDRAAAQHEALKAHVTAVVADGPGRGGAGSNPARSEGLPAETAPAGPVVPPPATARPPRRRP
jgi:hypothetical protein